MSVLDRIHHLMKLAYHTDTPESEARNAAYQVVKLIKENGILLSLPKRPFSSPHIGLVDVADYKPIVDHYTNSGIGDTDYAEKASAEPIEIPDFDDVETWEPISSFPNSNLPKQPRFRETTARYKGKCQCCGAQYPAGTKIIIVPGKGTTHVECRSYWEVR